MKDSLLNAVNQLRRDPLSLLTEIELWKSQFISDRFYKSLNKLYKLKEDKSILQQAQEFLKTVPRFQLEPLEVSQQLNQVAQQRAALLVNDLKAKSHHSSYIPITNFGQCSAVLADKDQLPFLLVRLVCDDGVPHRSNRRILLQRDLTSIGVGISHSKTGNVGVVLLMKLSQNQISCLIRFLSTLFCSSSYLTLMNRSQGNSSLQPDYVLILLICSLNSSGYIWASSTFFKAKFQTKTSSIRQSKSEVESSALRSW